MNAAPRMDPVEIMGYYMLEINAATCRTVLLGLLLGMVVLALGYAVSRRPGDSVRRPEWRPLVRVAAGAVILAATLFALVRMNRYTSDVQTALAHGMYDVSNPLDGLSDINRCTPAESRLPADMDGALVIYYRYGCPDCEAVYEDLKSRLDARGKPYYWISTRSNQGLALLDEYIVEDVPSALYIYPDGRGHAIASLHETDPATGRTVVPSDVFDYLDDVEARASSRPSDAVLNEIPYESTVGHRKPKNDGGTQPAVQLIWQFLSPEDALYGLLSDETGTAMTKEGRP